MKKMLDSEECTLSLDNFFFERPVVHKVKPLCQEASPWQLEAPPSLSQIPATQDLLKEAEGLSLFGFSQKPKKFLPPLKEAAGSCGSLPNKNCSQFSQNDRYEKAQSSSLWDGEHFMDLSQGSFRSDRGEDETPMNSDQTQNRKYFTLDSSQNPQLRRSLFNPPSGQVLNSRGSASLSSSDSISSQTARPRVQTFLRRVPMATESAPLPTAASQSSVVPRLPSRPHLFPGPVGVSAASGGQPQAKETQDKGTKRAHVFPMTPQPLQIQGNTGSLRPVSEISAKFRSVFKEFPFFNYVQSKALDDVLYTAKNFVASAPTGSGKTVLFELAIVRLLMETSEPWRNVKAVYMAPIKALCSQRFEDWKQKFGPLGLSCKELTGDTEIDDFFEIQDAHIIMTTPEKWDSMTRKWRDNCLLQLVRLFLIDEVHVVKDPTRGATLEVVVSRMKTVRKARAGDNPQGDLSMRFVAVSATIPNISDIADWLCDEHAAATCLDMDESCRPVKLRKVVLGFPYNSSQTEFKFDLSLNYKMANIIQTYSDQKPALVFCSTRKGVQQSATVLAKDARFIMSIDHKQRLMKYANSILDSKLRDLVMMGVGFHHAGVDVSDRKKVEEAFTLGDLPVLFTTSTLAMGVNLPAHLVVIKSTMHYIGGGCEEYSDADMLQMIGRAGRPQFDTSATAVIMTKFTTKEKYMKFLNGAEIIESSLHTNLVEHLNAEIVLQTISDVNMALDWIRSTFLYIRALKNPKHYGFSVDLDRCGIESKLQELCLKNLNSLSAIDLISMDEDVNIKPTDAGRLMAQFCVAFDTMKQFNKVDGNETLPELIELIAKGKEFCDVQLRVSEKRTLNTLNKDKNRITIRYPMEGKIKSNEMKVNCLIQANLGSIPIQEFGLTQDTGRIFRNGVRISKCLAEFLNQRSKAGFSALLNSVILAKCFKAKLWENSPYVSKQLEKIGLTLSTAMVNAGITTFNKIEQTNARELELIVNRHPPFGNQIRDAVINLPKYEVSFVQLPRYNVCTAEIVVTVNLKNQEQLLSKRTAPDYHYVTLIIGDSDNNVVYLQKLKDLVLLKSGNWSKKIEVAKASSGDEISCNLISSEYVGLDIQQKFSVFYSGAKRFGAEPMEPPRHTEWRVQGTSCNKTDQPRAAQGAGQRPQPFPFPQGASQRSYPGAAYALDSYDTGKRGCNHYCKNKDLCGHECCKVGVPVVVKQPRNQVSGFSSYLQELKSKSDTLMETPVKRLKMRMVGESVSANMQQFSYKPREKLPRYGNNQFEARIHPQVVDLTEEVATPQEMAYLEDFGNEYADYLEDIYESMRVEETAPQAQSSTVWSKPGVCNVGCPIKASMNYCPNPQPTLNPPRGYRPTSCSMSNRSNDSAVAPLLDTLTVNFDLGDEWDDWDDFEDVNLLHASEQTLSACTAKTKTQGSDYNRTAYLTPVPPVQAQPKPHVSMNSAPLRSVSHPVPAEVTVGSPPLTIKPQLSTAWNRTNNKRQSVFSEEFTVKVQAAPHFETILASGSGKFDFFSKQSSNKYKQNVTGNNSLQADGSEEEAFLGIFDGIF